MSVSLLHALFLFKRPTAKAGRMRSRGKIRRMFSALWGLRVLPDKQVVPSGHCLRGDLRNPLMAEKKRENKRKSEEKRDTTSEATWLQIALKNVKIRDNNIRAY